MGAKGSPNKYKKSWLLERTSYIKKVIPSPTWPVTLPFLKVQNKKEPLLKLYDNDSPSKFIAFRAINENSIWNLLNKELHENPPKYLILSAIEFLQRKISHNFCLYTTTAEYTPTNWSQAVTINISLHVIYRRRLLKKALNSSNNLRAI